jgi:hypothetical protein
MLKEEAENGGGSSSKKGSFLAPNYPPPARKSKEEMIEEAANNSKKGGFLTPNYPPPKREPNPNASSSSSSSKKSTNEKFNDEGGSNDDDDGDDEVEQDESVTPSKPTSRYSHSSSKNNINPNGSIRLTEDLGPSQIDWKLLTVAAVMILFIVGIAVGVGVGLTNRNNREAESEAEAAAAETTMTPTTTTSCTLMEFPYTTSVVMTLSTSDGESNMLTEDEITYISSVLEKTYDQIESVLLNGDDVGAEGRAEGDGDDEIIKCDPYHRTITSMNITDVVTTSGSAMDMEGLEGECTSMTEVTLAVSGMYWTCEEEEDDEVEFPGLFTMMMTEDDADVDVPAAAAESRGGSGRGRRGRRLLRGGRHGRKLAAAETAPMCPEGSIEMSPTSDMIVELMAKFLTLLPNVCGVTNVVEV